MTTTRRPKASCCGCDDEYGRRANSCSTSRDEALRSLLDDEELSDVVLVVSADDGCTAARVPALKALLASRSPVFRRLLFGQFVEARQKEVEIGNGRLGFGGDVVRAVVEYSYTDSVALLEQAVVQNVQDDDDDEVSSASDGCTTSGGNSCSSCSRCGGGSVATSAGTSITTATTTITGRCRCSDGDITIEDKIKFMFDLFRASDFFALPGLRSLVLRSMLQFLRASSHLPVTCMLVLAYIGGCSSLSLQQQQLLLPTEDDDDDYGTEIADVAYQAVAIAKHWRRRYLRLLLLDDNGDASSCSSTFRTLIQSFAPEHVFAVFFQRKEEIWDLDDERAYFLLLLRTLLTSPSSLALPDRRYGEILSKVGGADANSDDSSTSARRWVAATFLRYALTPHVCEYLKAKNGVVQQTKRELRCYSRQCLRRAVMARSGVAPLSDEDLRWAYEASSASSSDGVFQAGYYFREAQCHQLPSQSQQREANGRCITDRLNCAPMITGIRTWSFLVGGNTDRRVTTPANSSILAGVSFMSSSKLDLDLGDHGHFFGCEILVVKSHGCGEGSPPRPDNSCGRIRDRPCIVVGDEPSIVSVCLDLNGNGTLTASVNDHERARVVDLFWKVRDAASKAVAADADSSADRLLFIPGFVPSVSVRGDGGRWIRFRGIG